MPWATIATIVLTLLKWMVGRSEKSQKAEKQFSRIVKEMDRMSKELNDLRFKYEEAKEAIEQREIEEKKKGAI